MHEEPAAQAALVKILSLIPAVSGPEAPALPDLLAAVRELEFAVMGNFVAFLAPQEERRQEDERHRERASQQIRLLNQAGRYDEARALERAEFS